jgi:hypothetical protein
MNAEKSKSERPEKSIQAASDEFSADGDANSMYGSGDGRGMIVGIPPKALRNSTYAK